MDSNLIKRVKDNIYLTNVEKKSIVYFLTDEDYVNEHFAMVELAKVILRVTENRKDVDSVGWG